MNAACIDLYSEIDEAAADHLLAELDAHRDVDKIMVRINTPGGKILHGFRIVDGMAAARARGQMVVTSVEGVAGSSGCVVACAGSTVSINAGGFMKPHEPHDVEGGTARELRSKVKLLDEYAEKTAQHFRAKTALPIEKCRRLVNEGPWLTASEAIKTYLADRVDHRSPHRASDCYALIDAVVPPSIGANNRRRPIDTLLNEIEVAAKYACESWAQEKAERFFALPGTTEDDLERVATALKRIDDERYWPRQF